MDGDLRQRRARVGRDLAPRTAAGTGGRVGPSGRGPQRGPFGERAAVAPDSHPARSCGLRVARVERSRPTDPSPARRRGTGVALGRPPRGVPPLREAGHRCPGDGPSVAANLGSRTPSATGLRVDGCGPRTARSGAPRASCRPAAALGGTATSVAAGAGASPRRGVRAGDVASATGDPLAGRRTWSRDSGRGQGDFGPRASAQRLRPPRHLPRRSAPCDGAGVGLRARRKSGLRPRRPCGSVASAPAGRGPHLRVRPGSSESR
jgi:hypothetical protein